MPKFYNSSLFVLLLSFFVPTVVFAQAAELMSEVDPSVETIIQ